MSRSPWRRKLIVLLVIAIFCLGLARFTVRFSGGTAVKEVLAPLQGGVMSLWRGVSSTFQYVGRARQIKQENERLQEQVRELTWENNRLHEYVYENRRLLKLLDFKERNAKRFTLLGARVIGRVPNNQYGILTVDRGSVDGVRKDQVVVSDAGLVGRIIAVGPHTSDVLLILDRDGAAGAMVQESRTPGVVEGGKDEPGLLRMVDLPYDAKLKKGEVVVTSGLGGIFPRGIPIGEIVKFENQGSELDKYALVRPYVDFNRLEEVLIITGVREVPEPVEGPAGSNQAEAGRTGQNAATASQTGRNAAAAGQTRRNGTASGQVSGQDAAGREPANQLLVRN